MKLKITLFILLASIGIYTADAQCYEEQNGIVVVETESPSSLPSGWSRESSATPFTGSSYIAWRGPDYFNSPGNGVITYPITINSPGTYRFMWRSKVGIGNEFSEHNDSWLKIEANNFFAQNGASIKYPIGSGNTPEVNGSGSGGWFKIFLTGTTNWTWSTLTSDFDGHFVYATFNSPGVYNVRISGRSNGHFIDRFVLFKESIYSAGQAGNTELAQTSCGGSTPPPPPPPPPPPSGENEPPTVSITSPSNGANISAGSNVSVSLSASDPDGSISQHQIFVNNTLVDTDGSFYSPHIIQNIAEGSYTIRARVTDNSGATAESSVSITVGSGGSTPPPPPPPPPSSGDNNPPSVSITSPGDGQNFAVGSTVTVGVSASDSDGSVVKYQVFVNGVLRDTDGTSYTPYQIPNISAGSYEIKVTVTDNEGATTTATANITVGGGGSTPPPPPPPPSGDNIPPTVSITSPANGATFDAGSTVTVNVSASDSDGSVVKHQVYVNDVLRDTDPANYTPYRILNITEGSYAIRVVVTDDDGATASATVNIGVGDGAPPPPPPPPPTSGNDISLTLINATTDTGIGPLTNGTVVTTGSNVNVLATVANSNVKSVYFQLQGATSRNWTENVQPFALFGDISGNYANGSFNGGSHTLTVEAYSGLNRSGSKLETLIISFSVSGGGKSAIAYPNPVKQGPVSVKLPEEIKGEAAYAVISPSGTEVARGTIDSRSLGDDNSLQIKTDTMKNDGVYYLVIQANYDVYTVPIIKQ